MNSGKVDTKTDMLSLCELSWFIAWLEAQDSGVEVGVRYGRSNHPFANYLKYHGIAEPGVDPSFIWGPNTYYGRTPRWVGVFLRNLRWAGGYNRLVTVGECLNALKNVERGEE